MTKTGVVVLSATQQPAMADEDVSPLPQGALDLPVSVADAGSGREKVASMVTDFLENPGLTPQEQADCLSAIQAEMREMEVGIREVLGDQRVRIQSDGLEERAEELRMAVLVFLGRVLAVERPMIPMHLAAWEVPGFLAKQEPGRRRQEILAPTLEEMEALFAEINECHRTGVISDLEAAQMRREVTAPFDDVSKLFGTDFDDLPLPFGCIVSARVDFQRDPEQVDDSDIECHLGQYDITTELNQGIRVVEADRLPGMTGRNDEFESLWARDEHGRFVAAINRKPRPERELNKAFEEKHPRTKKGRFIRKRR